MIDLELKSDYHDYYDHCFSSRDRGDLTFVRNAVDSWCLKRADHFKLFKSLKLETPKFGLVSTFDESDEVVVYLDETSHCGENKILVVLNEELKETYKNYNCSKYIKGSTQGESFRLLSIGGIQYWFQMVSTEDWRSNCGDGDIFPVKNSLKFKLPRVVYDHPIWAIDFVRDINNKFFAIDFNTAPKGAGTGIQKILEPQKAYEGICRIVQERISRKKDDMTIFDNNQISLTELDENFLKFKEVVVKELEKIVDKISLYDIDLYNQKSSTYDWKEDICKTNTLFYRYSTSKVSGGNCWGGELVKEEGVRDPKIIDLFLKSLIIKHCSNIPFAKFLEIELEIFEDEECVREYYGNSTDYISKTLCLVSLWNIVKDYFVE